MVLRARSANTGTGSNIFRVEAWTSGTSAGVGRGAP
jgi:hypothetical protein